MTPIAASEEAELLQDRLELLRLRTLLVGAMGMVGLVVGLVASLGYGTQALKLIAEALVGNTQGLHVPNNLFQAPADPSWARSPMLLQLAFVAIGIIGIAQMTRQVLSTVQIRVWFAVLLGLAAAITYTQSDVGSVWYSAQRDLVKAVRAKEWARVEQLSATSQNAVAHRYVMAQVGLAKHDPGMLELHGKVLVDQIDDMLLRRGPDRESQDGGLLTATDDFRPHILQDIDVAVYGAPHTEIGLRLAQSTRASTQDTSGWAWSLARALFCMLAAVAGIGGACALLMLWKRMAARLRWLRPWVIAAT